MRNINDIKSTVESDGNNNGSYERMLKSVTEESRERFHRKPWYLQAAENLKRLREEKGD